MQSFPLTNIGFVARVGYACLGLRLSLFAAKVYQTCGTRATGTAHASWVYQQGFQRRGMGQGAILGGLKKAVPDGAGISDVRDESDRDGNARRGRGQAGLVARGGAPLCAQAPSPSHHPPFRTMPAFAPRLTATAAVSCPEGCRAFGVSVASYPGGQGCSSAARPLRMGA